MTTTTKPKSGYKVCAKCKVRYSTLTRHKCFTPDKGEAKEKLEPTDPTELKGGGHGQGSADSDGDNPSDSKGDGDSQGQGEGEGEQGDGEAEGDGEGGDQQGEGQSDGQGDGDGDGDGEEEEVEGEGPPPQPPEPEAPPVSVVCSVLKFAALTAQAAKAGVVSVELTEHGLLVYGHNGDLTAHAVMPWGEFETRSTVDGQFYVKEVIDGVDAKIDEAKLSYLERAQAASDAYKLKKARGANDKVSTKSETAAILTLPLTVGQVFTTRDGVTGTVTEVRAKDREVYVALSTGPKYWYHSDTGHFGNGGGNHHFDAVADAPAEQKPALTLPLTLGQRFIRKNGDTVTIKCLERRDGMDVAVTDNDSRVWADTGSAKGEGRHDFGAADRVDAVRDADDWKPALTLPFYVGQRVVTIDGRTVIIDAIDTKDAAFGEDGDTVRTNLGWHRASDGKYGRSVGEYDNDYPLDIVRDAD